MPVNASTQGPFEEGGRAGPAETGPHGARIWSPDLPVPRGDIRVLHAAPRYIVVEKPPWLLSVPGKGPDKQDCIASRIAARFPHASGPLIVHRLDMETSGLMVLGLDAAAQRDLSMQFERREVEKQYVALVNTPPVAANPGKAPPQAELRPGDSGIITLPMRADIDNRPRQVVDYEQGRSALTRWEVVSHETDRVRMRLVPETGRTHQLRVHMAIGLQRPIVGDPLYGGEPAPRLMLHAARLSFVEPGGRRRVEFESAVPF